MTTKSKTAYDNAHERCRDMNITNRGFEVFTLLVDNDQNALNYWTSQAQRCDFNKAQLAAVLQNHAEIKQHNADRMHSYPEITALLAAMLDAMDWEAIAEHYINKAKDA